MLHSRKAALALVCSLAVGCSLSDLERPPRAGDPVPDLSFAELDTGDSISFADYEGEVVLVNLWATWCAPCRFETPYLQSVYEENAGRGFRIAGVSIDSPTAVDLVREFTEDKGVTYDILLDPESVSTSAFGAFGLPVSLLVDREGVIRWLIQAPIVDGDPEFLRALEDLLG